MSPPRACTSLKQRDKPQGIRATSVPSTLCQAAKSLLDGSWRTAPQNVSVSPLDLVPNIVGIYLLSLFWNSNLQKHKNKSYELREGRDLWMISILIIHDDHLQVGWILDNYLRINKSFYISGFQIYLASDCWSYPQNLEGLWELHF